MECSGIKIIQIYIRLLIYSAVWNQTEKEKEKKGRPIKAN
jgi:hypothetical protein